MIKEELLIVGNFRSGNISRKRSNNVSNYNHILNVIETSLKAKGDTREWKTIKEVLNTHVRNTVVMSGKDMTWHIRVSGTPESQHLEIYNALKVKDPLKRNKQNIHLRL